ncbi:endoribonuclease Dicer [Marchantia polymorpha subsp. ruderalis]
METESQESGQVMNVEKADDCNMEENVAPSCGREVEFLFPVCPQVPSNLKEFVAVPNPTVANSDENQKSPAIIGANVPCMTEENLAKRKREEMNAVQNPTLSEVEIEDPLFATRTKKRQRTVEKPKKVNGIVKKVIRKSSTVLEAEEDPSLVKDPEGKARRYQLEVLVEAQKRNTIVYLETGCGKTLIAVLLMKSLAQKLRIPEKKKVAVFLAPTVHLVRQQSSVINLHTDLRVGEYFGSLGVDTWKPEKWQEEINNHEVLVMTPQILVDLLTHGIIKLEVIELLIFDECHHAHKKHAYCKIMDRYRDVPESCRPKVFGMTASPVIRKGVSSGADCELQLGRLEQKLDAKVFAVKDRSELESFVPTPLTQGIDFDTPTVDVEEYKLKLQAIAEKYQQFGKARHGGNDEQFKDYEELSKKLQKSINRFYNALVYCLVELGLWCAHKAAELLLKNDFKDILSEPDMDVVAILKSAKDNFLKEAIDVLKSPLPKDPFSTDQEMDKAVILGQLTPKVKKLVDVLVKYREVKDMRCIVFVDRVVGALVLSNLINSIKILAFLRCEYLAGINGALDAPTRTFQDQVILNFRTGKLNLLVATNVAEEGLDVQGCHSVVRFDICKTVRSYIQSRGRARRPGSDYIVFMEKGNDKQKEEFKAIVQSESKMIESALDRAGDQVTQIKPPTVVPVEVFRVQSTGASLTTDSSIAFIYRFCSKLPGDKYYTPRPEFIFSEEADKMHICTLKLPPNATIHELVGPKRKTAVLAKQVVCLEACRMLHTLGAITDHLLPVIDDGKVEEEDIMNLKTLKNRGAGTTKQKELHGTVVATKLRGSWGTTDKGHTFHAYSLIFSPEEHETIVYANFAFLVETKLDDDVARLEVELALKAGKMGRAKFYPAGEVALTREQIKDCKDSQELFFNGMFSKLVTRASKGVALEPSKGLVTLTPHKSLVIATDEDRSRIWDQNKMYLLLPLLHTLDGVKVADAISSSAIYAQPDIDWECVSRTAEAARSFRSIYTPAVGNSTSISEEGLEIQPPTTSPQVENGNLKMAFGVTARVSKIVDTVVLTVHTGMLYCITKVLHNRTAKCPFPESNENEDQKFSSYGDYFRQKHKQILLYAEQPMLQAKQTHRPRNLLARNSVNGSGKGKKKSKGNSEESENCYIELPPELCIVLGVSDAVVRSAYLLPSVMHRLDAALAASQLREMITKDFPHPVIPVMRIVESLTTLRCLEEFSLEGLELLGDSFLKYAWSKSLFLTHHEKHEGQLSARRCREICNAKLHDLALRRDLPQYIRDEVFDPSRWVPPGMHCPKILLCRCDLKNLNHDQTEDAEDDEKPKQIQKVVKIGKSCANGHRWLCSKTISDVVEALIGAYLVDSDDSGALNFMTWVGMEVKVEQALVDRAKGYTACDPTVNVGADLKGLEVRLNYSFINKALLVEAITHASHQELKGGFCYQRLEFLGDAVLDYLITRHLYFSHPGLTPGRLTDLRSAAVNNECFARIAVKHCLNKYLRHGSGFLLKQIEEFVQIIEQSGEIQKTSSFGWDGVKGPKVLGDLVESIAGAILVDTGFDLETVWVVMKPLLSPIVTPETLPLHPVRELQELCHLKDYSVVLNVEQENKMSRVTIDVSIGDKTLSATSCQMQKKTAQKDAAQQMLALLKIEGIWHPWKATVVECPHTPAKVVEQPFVPPGYKRKLDKIREAETREEKKVKVTFEAPQDLNFVNPQENVNMSCSAVLLCSDEHRKEIESEGQTVVVPA